MSYVDELLDAYRRFVSLAWQENLAPAQRVWMAVSPPEYERRLRLHVPDFAVATKEANHGWALIDLTTSFERWMANHPYRDEYFESPNLFSPALPAFFDHLVADTRRQLEMPPSPGGVVGLLGAGTLFGLGEAVRVSALLNAVNDAISGRLLVSSVASTRATATACWTRATAGITWPLRSRQTGAPDDDSKPRSLLPGPDANEDPERGRSRRSSAPRRSSNGRFCSGSSGASSVRASTRADSGEFSAAS